MLLCFRAVPRLRTNLEKFQAISVGEVDNVGELANVLDCRVAQLLMTYLRLPLRARFKSIHIWNSIVEKVERQLVG